MNRAQAVRGMATRPPLHRQLAVLLCLAVLLVAPAYAREDEGGRGEPLKLDQLRQERARAEENLSLPEDVRTRLTGLLDEAVRALEAEAGEQRQARDMTRQQAAIAAQVRVLEATLDQPEVQPALRLPEEASLEQTETELEREQARLTANLAALRQAESFSEQRTERRRAIARLLGQLDQKVVNLDDQLRSVSREQMAPELAEAARTLLLAQRQAAMAELERSRRELSLLEAQGALVPLEIDLAQRRVAYSERLVPMLERRADEVRRRYAQASLDRIRDVARRSESIAPSLAVLAEEVDLLAREVWGAEGVASRSSDLARQIVITRKYVADLDRIAELTRREFAAFGYSGSIARWWPEIPQDFPRPGDIARQIARLDQRIPEAQHEIIRLEQMRAARREVETQLRTDLVFEIEEGAEQAARQAGRLLLEERRELLDALIIKNGRYADQLNELRSVSAVFLQDAERIQTFLFERLLWARSVPRPVIPRLNDAWGGFLWLNNWSSWQPALGIGWRRVTEIPVRGLMAVAGFTVLVFMRRRIRRRMATLAERCAEVATDRLRWTLEAMLHTALLAAPLPLFLFTAHRVLLQASESTFLFTAAQALGYVAALAAVLEMGRQMMAPRGLGEAHFGWPPRVMATFHGGTGWVVWTFLALMQVSLHLVMAGQRISSPADLQLFNNAFGRVVFIIAMLLLGFTCLALLGRHRWQEGSSKRSRLHVYAVPFTIVVTLVPALLAAVGYYITALLMSYQVLRTLALLLGVTLAGGVLLRICDTRQRQRQPSEEDAATTTAADVADAQVRRLFRFLLVLATFSGLYLVWADALPTLQLMKRVQVWPRVALVHEEVDPFLAPAVESPAVEASQDAPTPAMRVPGVTSAMESTEEPAAEATEALTLWSLFEALLVVLITVELVKNLPGLLQLTLQRRSMLDSGARIAISTLVRYATIILGVSIAFSLVGISWSRIQWLAAALTFGLGFGLQEIVANFVSGLILLTERPVRVGDAVTIGNLQGRVSRIQIRATTISLWDSSEMIVPNKEFITSKLVNWTLTDSRRRIDVPARVAYGSDVALVKRAMLQVAEACPDVVPDPPPQVLLLEFGEDALKFELRAFVEFGQGLKVRDELHMAVDETFRREGIEFALPQMRLQWQRRQQTEPAGGRPQDGPSAPVPPPAAGEEESS